MNTYIICCLYAELCESDQRNKNRHIYKLMRDRNDPFSIPNNIFEKNYGLSKMLCHQLIQQLKPHDNENSTISFEFRLMAALNFYAHGTHQTNIGKNSAIPLSQSTVSRAIQNISKLICLVKRTEVRFPQTAKEISKTKKGFYNAFGIKATIGAVDCIHIGMIAPKKNGSLNPLSLYMNTKGFYSINVEAICDYRLLFTSINANYPGSYKNNSIWTTSLARLHLMANHTQSKHTWLLGEQGYPLEPWLMTPLAAPSSANERRYNEMHNKARNTIKRAFGVLKSRFRCLNKILYYEHERASNIVGACFILHNILIRHGAPTDIDQLQESSESLDCQSVQEEGSSTREAVNLRKQYIASLSDGDGGRAIFFDDDST